MIIYCGRTPWAVLFSINLLHQKYSPTSLRNSGEGYVQWRIYFYVRIIWEVQSGEGLVNRTSGDVGKRQLFGFTVPFLFTVTPRPTEPTTKRLETTASSKVNEHSSHHKEDITQGGLRPYHILKHKLHKHKHSHHKGRTTTITGINSQLPREDQETE